MNELDDIRELFARLSTPRGGDHPDEGDAGRARWDELEALGLTSVCASEAVGGGGGLLAHGVEVAVSAGRYCLSGPVGDSVLVATWLLEQAKIDIPGGPLTTGGFRVTDEVTARPEGETLHLQGLLRDVPWPSFSSALVVHASSTDGPVAAVVPTAAVEISPAVNLANEERSGVAFSAIVPFGSWGVLPASVTAPSVRARGALARAAAIVGALERVEAMTLRFVQDRQQFGKPIIRFQAVAQTVAMLSAEVALARSSLTVAARAAAAGEIVDIFNCGAAKVTSSRSARLVTSAAHQLHGAIGVTAEYPLQQLTRRLLAWQDEEGTEDAWAVELGRLLPDLGPTFWAALSTPGDGG